VGAEKEVEFQLMQSKSNVEALKAENVKEDHFGAAFEEDQGVKEVKEERKPSVKPKKKGFISSFFGGGVESQYYKVEKKSERLERKATQKKIKEE